jgi:hypothetical protein
MRSTLLSLLLTTILVISATLPFVRAGGGKHDGPSFCQTVDKLKVTSPLTFIRPVPSVNLKWNPKICLCQSEGELTDATIARLEAKIKQEGTKKLANKLGLDTLPAYWEELFVRQAVINAAEEFVSRSHILSFHEEVILISSPPTARPIQVLPSWLRVP